MVVIGEAGGDDLELGEPVAHDIAHVRAVSQARPNPQQRVAGIGSARDPDLSFELLDLDGLGAGEWVVRRNADNQLAL